MVFFFITIIENIHNLNLSMNSFFVQLIFSSFFYKELIHCGQYRVLLRLNYRMLIVVGIKKHTLRTSTPGYFKVELVCILGLRYS